VAQTDDGVEVKAGNDTVRAPLIHISQLAAHRVQHPSEVISVGETITVLVLGVDTVRERVSLSLTTTSADAASSRETPKQARPRMAGRRRWLTASPIL
jgi:ribosomal protein S1